MSRCWSIALVALCLLAPRPGAGQRVAKPDSGKAQAEQAPATAGPTTGRMTEATLEGMLRVMAKPENAERLATFTRNYYDALIQRGFSREEALQIVIRADVLRMPTWPR